MDPDGPSRTALGSALQRATHQIVDLPRVFEDDLALKIIGSPAERGLRAELSTRSRSGSGATRAFLAARSRYAEDCLAEAVARGVRRYVILGAGLDTFAYRDGFPGLQVLELDHPGTQKWKRDLLEAVGIPVPDRVRYAAIDFERETLAEGLSRAGFEFGEPAFFAWLGVTIYLTPRSIFETLETIARRLAKGSEVVFDYAGPLDVLPPDRRAAFLALTREAARIGEPYRSSFEPEALSRELRALGFANVVDADAEALNERYFRGREDGLALRGPGHLMRAGT